jgi:hypothetical protein
VSTGGSVPSTVRRSVFRAHNLCERMLTPGVGLGDEGFCGILYVGDIAKFPCFCLWQSFGLWLKFSEMYLGCNVLLQGIITCVNTCSHQVSVLGMYPLAPSSHMTIR